LGKYLLTAESQSLHPILLVKFQDSLIFKN